MSILLLHAQAKYHRSALDCSNRQPPQWWSVLRLLELRYNYTDKDLIEQANCLVRRLLFLLSYTDRAVDYQNEVTVIIASLRHHSSAEMRCGVRQIALLPIDPRDILHTLESPASSSTEYQMQLLCLTVLYACSRADDELASDSATYHSLCCFLVYPGTIQALFNG